MPGEGFRDARTYVLCFHLELQESINMMCSQLNLYTYSFVNWYIYWLVDTSKGFIVFCQSYHCSVLQMLGRDSAVPLSNSLSLADRHRMAYLKKQQGKNPSSDNCPFRFGQLALSPLNVSAELREDETKYCSHCLVLCVLSYIGVSWVNILSIQI